MRPSAASLIDSSATRYIAMIDELGLTNLRTRYIFSKNEDVKPLILDDPGRFMQIYWGEILARAHLTAITSILRNRHWVSAVIAAAEDKNLLSFAASLRGLIESAADSQTALKHIPRRFAINHAQIMCALSGKLERVNLLDGEMEDKLIHFAYARKLTKAERAEVPESHQVMKVRDYIDELEEAQVHNIVECYDKLCDLTHPGASSVWMLLHSVNDLEMELIAGQDDSEISRFLNDYRRTILDLIMLAFNPGIITLRVLNYFTLVKFHVPALDRWDLSGVPIWQKCHADLKGITPKTGAQLKIV